MRQGKVLQTQTYTSRDTSRHGRCDGELAGHVGVVFAEIGTGLCETDIRRFQTSFLGPNASSDLVKTPVRPPFSIGTHEITTKLNGVEVRVATKRPQGLGGRALGLAHDRELRGVSTRKRG